MYASREVCIAHIVGIEVVERAYLLSSRFIAGGTGFDLHLDARRHARRWRRHLLLIAKLLQHATVKVFVARRLLQLYPLHRAVHGNAHLNYDNASGSCCVRRNYHRRSRLRTTRRAACANERQQQNTKQPHHRSKSSGDSIADCQPAFSRQDITVVPLPDRPRSIRPRARVTCAFAGIHERVSRFATHIAINPTCSGVARRSA